MPPENQIELSVVATIYNSGSMIPKLVNGITTHLAPLNIQFEILLVDDRSKDDSWPAIADVCKLHSHVKGIRLSRNYGQQIAMSAGIHAAGGNYIVVMDGDLQNPPEFIPVLYNKIRAERLDLVYTVSKTRNNLLDELTSSLFWFIIRRVLNVKIIAHQLMMKIMTRRLAVHYGAYPEIHRTVAGIMQDIGLTTAVVAVPNRRRESGRSNYNFMKRLNLMIDIVISMSSSPLNLMLYLGGITFVITFIGIIYYLAMYLFDEVPPGYTSIIFSVSFFGSLIVMMLGFIGRYLSNIYSEVRRRPLFIEDERINL